MGGEVVDALKAAVKDSRRGVKRVIFNVFKDEDKRIYDRLLNKKILHHSEQF